MSAPIIDQPPQHIKSHRAGPKFNKYAPTVANLLRAERLLFEDIFTDGCDKDYRLRALAAIDRIEERKRILRMKPKPAAARVPAEPKARVRSPAPEAPGPVTAAGPTDPGPTDPKV